VTSLRDLEDVVAASVLDEAAETASLLARLGIPHALVGGLAVGLHGFPRATKDVDFLVGPEAFERMEPLLVYRDELKAKVEIGVVDLLAVPTQYPTLAEQLAVTKPGQVHVIAVEALILMKLEANRAQDRADVARLIQTGIDAEHVAAYLADHAPQLLNRFAELLQQ